MSDKIPTQDDGSPDFKTTAVKLYTGCSGLAPNTDEIASSLKQTYIAALERCADQAQLERQGWNKECAYMEASACALLAATIRQWIKKEKSNG